MSKPNIFSKSEIILPDGRSLKVPIGINTRVRASGTFHMTTCIARHQVSLNVHPSLIYNGYLDAAMNLLYLIKIGYVPGYIREKKRLAGTAVDLPVGIVVGKNYKTDQWTACVYYPDVGSESVKRKTFHLGNSSTYLSKYNDVIAKCVEVRSEAMTAYAQEFTRRVMEFIETIRPFANGERK